MGKLELPDDVPIAVADRRCLARFGVLEDISGISPENACVMTALADGEKSIWCRLEYGSYRKAWEKAAAQRAVDELASYGTCFDLDHLASRAVARKLNLAGWLLRVHPVYAEVNRSAGAGREKYAAGSRGSAEKLMMRRAGDVFFAGELQFLKIIGHPVGTAADPMILFD